jgi:hypothetical protein
MRLCKIFTLLIPIFLFNTLSAQTDSLILINGDVIIGEVKSMNKSVISIETDYSDSDFKIEWEGIKEIYTEREFIINLNGGKRLIGTVRTTSPKMVMISHLNANEEVDIASIIFLDEYGSGFLSNFYASVGLGLNLTKANDFSQFSLNITSGYLAEKWTLDLNFNSLSSNQNEVDPTKRIEGGLDYKYLLPKNWYATAGLNMLSNTEQALKLRTNVKLGAGYFAIKNNILYWGLGAGGAVNIESFSNETPDRQSIEAYFGTEINLFNVSDFSLQSSVYAYPSITEGGRWRVDYMLNTKYDLPLDFYVGLNFSFNYDNRPAEVGKDFDYVFGVNFGWDW